MILWQRSFLQFFGRKLLFRNQPKKGGIVVAKANDSVPLEKRNLPTPGSGAAEHSTSLTSSGQSLLLPSPQRGAVHRRPSLQPFLWAQQPHKPNEIREGKNKGAIGLRRVVRENTDDAIEPLNQTHDDRQSSNPLAQANPQAKQHGNEQRDATRGRITCKAVGKKTGITSVMR